LSTKKRVRAQQNWQEAQAVSVIKTSINWLQGKVSKRPTKEPCAWGLEPSESRINGIQISVPTSYKDIHQPFGLFFRIDSSQILPTRRYMQNSSQSIRQRPTDPTDDDNDDVIRFDFATLQEASYSRLM
jgi:hypothetical protein